VPAAIRQGVALVPEDRQHLGLVLPLPVGTNLTLAVLRGLSRFGFPSKRQEAPLIARLMKELDIRAASAAVPAETLSGGNQQKVVLGKWLAASPRVLILDEPTRGVDVGAKAEVHRLIRSLAQQGMATLLISSDLPELLAMSDRILVMRAGRLAGELGRAEATPEKVLALALGQAPAGAAAGKESA
jgi:ABC-type sugar transport system ATPase subunit